MATLAAILGRDPWAFQLLNPTRDFTFVLFGWTYYEAAECLSILVRARERRKSAVYLGIVVALFFQLLSTTLQGLKISSTRDPSENLLLGPTKFGIDITSAITQILGRMAYFFTTVKITLAVFPRDRPVQLMLCVVTVFGIVGNIIYSVGWIGYMWAGFSHYLFYQETNNASLVLARLKTPVRGQVDFQSAALVENISLLLFIVLTKVPFLLKLYSSLNVGVREALWSMVSEKSSQRLFLCIFVAIAEAIIAFVAPRDMKTTASNYSKVFQINSLAIMAFEGTATIIKEHSSGQRRSSAKHPSTTKSPVSVIGTGRKSIVGEEHV